MFYVEINQISSNIWLYIWLILHKTWVFSMWKRKVTDAKHTYTFEYVGLRRQKKGTRFYHSMYITLYIQLNFFKDLHQKYIMIPQWNKITAKLDPLRENRMMLIHKVKNMLSCGKRDCGEGKSTLVLKSYHLIFAMKLTGKACMCENFILI